MSKPSRSSFPGRFSIYAEGYAQVAGGGKVGTATAWKRNVPGRLFGQPATQTPRHTPQPTELPTLNYTHRLMTPTDVSTVGPQWRVVDEGTGRGYAVASVRDEGGDGSTWTLYLAAE